jgi:hypothetical protein
MKNVCGKRTPAVTLSPFVKLPEKYNILEAPGFRPFRRWGLLVVSVG